MRLLAIGVCLVAVVHLASPHPAPDRPALDSNGKLTSSFYYISPKGQRPKEPQARDVPLKSEQVPAEAPHSRSRRSAPTQFVFVSQPRLPRFTYVRVYQHLPEPEPEPAPATLPPPLVEQARHLLEEESQHQEDEEHEEEDEDHEMLVHVHEAELRNANGPKSAVVVAKGPVTAVQEPVTAEQGPVTAAQGPVTAVQGPVTAGQEPVTAEQGPVTAAQGPVTAEQGPVTAEQGPVTAGQGPVTAMQGPVTAVQETVGELQEPVAAVQEPVTAVQETVGELQEPVTAAQEPVREVQEPVTAAQEPVGEVQVPVTAAQEPVGEVQEPAATPMEDLSDVSQIMPTEITKHPEMAHHNKWKQIVHKHHPKHHAVNAILGTNPNPGRKPFAQLPHMIIWNPPPPSVLLDRLGLMHVQMETAPGERLDLVPMGPGWGVGVEDELGRQLGYVPVGPGGLDFLPILGRGGHVDWVLGGRDTRGVFHDIHLKSAHGRLKMTTALIHGHPTNGIAGFDYTGDILLPMKIMKLQQSHKHQPFHFHNLHHIIHPTELLFH